MVAGLVRPVVLVKQSRMVIPRRARSVIIGSLGLRTCCLENSGRNRDTGSSGVSTPRSARMRVATPAIGLVFENIRNRVSLPAGWSESKSRTPRASKWTICPRRATNVMRLGTRLSATYASIAGPIRARRLASNPSALASPIGRGEVVMFLFLLVGDCPNQFPNRYRNLATSESTIGSWKASWNRSAIGFSTWLGSALPRL